MLELRVPVVAVRIAALVSLGLHAGCQGGGQVDLQYMCSDAQAGEHLYCAPLATNASYAGECLPEICVDLCPRPHEAPLLGDTLFDGGDFDVDSIVRWVYLDPGSNHVVIARFQGSLLGDFSDAELTSAFVEGEVHRWIELGDVGPYRFESTFDGVPALHLSEGRLRMEGRVRGEDVYYWINSSDPSCGYDDIGGECTCHYDVSDVVFWQEQVLNFVAPAD